MCVVWVFFFSFLFTAPPFFTDREDLSVNFGEASACLLSACGAG